MGIVKAADCAIFAAGERVRADIVQAYLSEDTFIITADAGYAFCKACAQTPNLIVGDFDSGVMPKTDIETVRLNPIKDATDSAVALEEALRRGFRNIVLFGATGGRLDHTFANLDLCAYAKESGASLTIVDDHHVIFTLYNETKKICADQSKYISVFAVGGAATVTLKDFAYPLLHHTLTPFCGLGVSNETQKDAAEIVAEKGTLLIFITDKDF